MRLSGWLGRRFGQDAVARVRNTHWGWLSLGRWVLRLRCAAAVVGCGGDKGEERAGSLRGGMERETGGRREENGWLGIERERGRDRERRHWQTG